MNVINVSSLARYAFTNRVHVFFMPILLTMFIAPVVGWPPLRYFAMIFFTTAGGYIFNIYTDHEEDKFNYESQYRIFRRDWPYIRHVIFACYATGLILSLSAGPLFVLYGFIINNLGRLYSAPITVRRAGVPQKIRVKEIPYLKNAYASLFWSAALVLTPCFYAGAAPSAAAYLLVAIAFGLSFCIELLWDLRDAAGDSLAGVRTIPVAYGVKAAHWILRLVHISTCAAAIAGVMSGLLPLPYLVSALHLVAGLIYLEWYMTLEDKTLHSHLFVVYSGTIVVIGILWQSATAL